LDIGGGKPPHMLEPPIKIGFLGGGMIAQICHLPFYLADPRCVVVRLAESRPSLVAAMRERLGAERVVGDHHALLKDPEISAIVISAPRPATGPLSLAALEAGKHVFAEKPMAHSAEQAQTLTEAATARGLTYAIGFMKRYDSGVQATKALFDAAIADGRLGRLVFARFYDFSNAYAVVPPAHVRPRESRVERFPTWPLYPSWLPERFHGTYAWFLNAASHDVNLLRYFFPGNVEVLAAQCSADACVTATCRQGDVTIALEISKSTIGQWVEGAEFLFEHGRIRLILPSPMSTGSVGEVILDDGRQGIAGERLKVGPGWAFARQARGFIDALSGAAKPLTSGDEGLADMLLTEQIWRRVAA
jgi:predicted dehydrogenase